MEKCYLISDCSTALQLKLSNQYDMLTYYCYKNFDDCKRKELVESGISIGNDILPDGKLWHA